MSKQETKSSARDFYLKHPLAIFYLEGHKKLSFGNYTNFPSKSCDSNKGHKCPAVGKNQRGIGMRYTAKIPHKLKVLVLVL